VRNDSEPVGEWLSPRQLQEWLGLGKTRVSELLGAGEIPSYKIGKRRIIRRSEVERWLEGCRYTPGGQE
jgi:excisionase family DNA binding protein